MVLASFHGELYDEYKRLQADGEVPKTFMYSPGTAGATKFFVLQLLGLDVFFTESLINRAHSHNLAVHYWTINDPEEMKYLINIDADGIMTDYPHLLKDI